MIHTADNFFNKVAADIRAAYFPNEDHGFTQSQNYRAANYTMELFNNGCLTYRKLIGRLAKYCKATTEEIHSIVEKHIISFGEYKYQPKKSIQCKQN
jgi:hypothetical protein